ncbi:TonB-dependent receptor [Sphingobium sp.]|uniref:TonB-dependent receptor n=1 Tax=Sphingobium sp. TaxID=1912891 RepID=UPI0028BEA5A8|nr:TonB-dependent receptor plug domain-containing protein [Sphingobium sp.]
MLESTSRIALCIASATLAGLAGAGSALAQTAPGPERTAISNSDDIIVTARRKEERQQDVPVAVSAVSGAQLERQAITKFSDISGKVPNLIISPGAAGSQAPIFSIRGLSQQDLTGLSDPSVSLYINEIVVPRPLGANLAFFDIASVQVLRGPQGTLFGRNTPGGAVVVTPNGASRNFEASIAQTVANYDTYITDAMINLPIGDTLSLRVAGQHKERGGYIFDVLRNNAAINDENSEGIRGTLDFHPNDRLTTVFSGGYANANNGGTGGFAIPIGGTPGAIEQLTRDNYHVASGLKAFTRVRNWNVENITTFKINDSVTLKNIVGYRKSRFHSFDDADGTAAVDIHIERFARQHQFSEEFQLLGDADWGSWITGAYYFQEKSDEGSPTVGNSSSAGTPTTLGASAFTSNADVFNDPLAGFCRNAAGLIVTPAPVLGNPAGCPSGYSLYGRYSRTGSLAKNTSAAFFLQTTFKMDSVAEGLSATIGVRQNYDRRQAVIRNRFDGPIVGPSAPGACRFFNAVSGDIPYSACELPLKANFREPTYNISLDWRLSPDVLTYLATRHGYRTGGYGARAVTVAGLRRTFQPEKVDDVELGLKADWHIGGTFLRTNFALFYADYRDIQRQLADISTIPVTTVVTNAGKARIQGLEFESIFRPVKWLEFSGFYSYTDAKFTSFLGPDGIDRTSVPFARAPKHIGSVSGRVFLPLDASQGTADIGFNWFAQSGFNSSDSWDPRFPVTARAVYWIKGYNITNFNAQWQNVMGSNFNVSVFVNNAFKTKYVMPFTGIAANPATGAGLVVRTPNEPRTYGLRLSYTFGH